MTLLILATAILLTLVFFNPQASLFWYNKQRTTVLSSVIYGVLLVMFIYFMTPADEERTAGSAVESRSIAGDTTQVAMVANITLPEPVVEEDLAKLEEYRVMLKLKAKAERDWPNDYTTQEYWINQEMEDYKYMLAIPEGPIKNQAEWNWPYDYTTQKYWFDEQIEGRERLNR